MKLLRLALARETAVPVLALGFASATTVALVAARIIWTRDVMYASLVWNLFLAWLPLGFSLLVREEFQSKSARGWRCWTLAAAWLLFFPNAPYIFTDVVHLTTYFYRHFWVDLVLILLCAVTGLILGFLSLFLVQGVVRKLYGTATSWAFVLGVAGLSGFGIYLGRYLRWNSWEVFTRPWKLWGNVSKMVGEPERVVAFSLTFFFFSLMAYFFVVAMARLHEGEV